MMKWSKYVALQDRYFDYVQFRNDGETVVALTREQEYYSDKWRKIILFRSATGEVLSISSLQEEFLQMSNYTRFSYLDNQNNLIIALNKTRDCNPDFQCYYEILKVSLDPQTNIQPGNFVTAQWAFKSTERGNFYGMINVGTFGNLWMMHQQDNTVYLSLLDSSVASVTSLNSYKYTIDINEKIQTAVLAYSQFIDQSKSILFQISSTSTFSQQRINASILNFSINFVNEQLEYYQGLSSMYCDVPFEYKLHDVYIVTQNNIQVLASQPENTYIISMSFEQLVANFSSLQNELKIQYPLHGRFMDFNNGIFAGSFFGNFNPISPSTYKSQYYGVIISSNPDVQCYQQIQLQDNQMIIKVNSNFVSLDHITDLTMFTSLDNYQISRTANSSYPAIQNLNSSSIDQLQNVCDSPPLTLSTTYSSINYDIYPLINTDIQEYTITQFTAISIKPSIQCEESIAPFAYTAVYKQNFTQLSSDIITFDGNSRKLAIAKTQQKLQFIILIIGTLPTSQQTFLTVNVKFEGNLGPPSFKSNLTDQTVLQGSTVQYILPQITDPDGDQITTSVDITTSGANSFVKYSPQSPSSGTFIMAPSFEQNGNSYEISITMTDNNKYPLSKTDKFSVNVQPQIIEKGPQKCFIKPYPKVIACKNGNVYLKSMDITADQKQIAVGGSASDQCLRLQNIDYLLPILFILDNISGDLFSSKYFNIEGHSIYQMVFTPDGKYLLLHTIGGENTAQNYLILVQLSDMSVYSARQYQQLKQQFKGARRMLRIDPQLHGIVAFKDLTNSDQENLKMFKINMNNDLAAISSSEWQIQTKSSGTMFGFLAQDLSENVLCTVKIGSTMLVSKVDHGQVKWSTGFTINYVNSLKMAWRPIFGNIFQVLNVFTVTSDQGEFQLWTMNVDMESDVAPSDQDQRLLVLSSQQNYVSLLMILDTNFKDDNVVQILIYDQAPATRKFYLVEIDLSQITESSISIQIAIISIHPFYAKQNSPTGRILQNSQFIALSNEKSLNIKWLGNKLPSTLQYAAGVISNSDEQAQCFDASKYSGTYELNVIESVTQITEFDQNQYWDSFSSSFTLDIVTTQLELFDINPSNFNLIGGVCNQPTFEVTTTQKTMEFIFFINQENQYADLSIQVCLAIIRNLQ